MRSASLAAVGAGLGLVLAGPIVSALDYHWLFWFPMIITAAAALAAVVFVPESPVRTPGQISVLPAVLLSAWLVCLLLALSQGSQWGWTSAAVLGLLVAAVVLAAVWVWVENRSASPLIDMHMMRLPAVWTTNLVALLVGFAMYASFAFLPQFSQTPSVAGYGFGASVTESGLILLPSSVTMFLAGMYSARAARQHRPEGRGGHRLADRGSGDGDGRLRPRPRLAAGRRQRRHGSRESAWSSPACPT